MGTIVDYKTFNAEEDCKVLKDAMEGLGTFYGTNENIILIVAQRSNIQRQELKQTYQLMYGKDLIKELKSKLVVNFKVAILALFTKTDEFEAVMLGDAMQRVDDGPLVEVMCSRTNTEMKAIAETYQRIFKQNLEEAIEESEISGNVQKACLAILKCGTDRLEYFADVLYNAMMKGDNKALIRILVSRSEVDLQQVKMIFLEKYGKKLEQFIVEECSGDFQELLVQIVRGNTFTTEQ